jgi:hypothetical protein
MCARRRKHRPACQPAGQSVLAPPSRHRQPAANQAQSRPTTPHPSRGRHAAVSAAPSTRASASARTRAHAHARARDSVTHLLRLAPPRAPPTRTQHLRHATVSPPPSALAPNHAVSVTQLMMGRSTCKPCDKSCSYVTVHVQLLPQLHGAHETQRAAHQSCRRP